MPGLVLAAAYICFAIVPPACQMLEIPSVSSLESIREVIPLVVPGFVFLWVRAQLLTGRLPAPSHAVLPWVISLRFIGTSSAQRMNCSGVRNSENGLLGLP